MEICPNCLHPMDGHDEYGCQFDVQGPLKPCSFKHCPCGVTVHTETEET